MVAKLADDAEQDEVITFDIIMDIVPGNLIISIKLTTSLIPNEHEQH